MRPALVIQLARLGDVVQSLPAVAALKASDSHRPLDLLCAAPFQAVGERDPAVDAVIAWDGAQWQRWARTMTVTPSVFDEARNQIATVARRDYARAYNLNQHARAVLAGHLFASEVVGPGEQGPLASSLPAWAAYLRQVAVSRAHNRVHLADAFCGMCGVRPTGKPSRLMIRQHDLPGRLAGIGNDDGTWVAVVVGAGEPERCVPPSVWAAWVRAYLDADGRGRVVLVGSRGERERACAVEEALPALLLGRVWNVVGETSLSGLMAVLARCHWVIGSDTGPLHLGAAVGARAVGWYFASARVHETGPYGIGHYVWQWRGGLPTAWPVRESVNLIVNGTGHAGVGEWRLWQSGLDPWGAYYAEVGGPSQPDDARATAWRQVSGATITERTVYEHL